MKFRNTYFVSGLGILMWIATALGQEQQSSLGSLVPSISQDHYRLIPEGQKYALVIDLPDGSRRVENVELRSSDTPEQELHVTGTITNFYPGVKVIIEYEAGRNGYIAKYKYKTELPGDISIGFLSPLALKSAAG